MSSLSEQPSVTVGIVSGAEIRFTLHAPYIVGESSPTGSPVVVSGPQVVSCQRGAIHWNGKICHSISFLPQSADAAFSLEDVIIGVNFHWERKETQTFAGELHLLIDDNKIWAINRLPVERYLESVISSEMSATSSLELLKAHAVISRSWLLSQIEKRQLPKANTSAAPQSGTLLHDRIIRWYDRQDHTLFDVCADDHCQRYQGITKETSPHVAEAIRQTIGQVLVDGDELCDARFSKCCGGITEEFQYCWENTPKDYLKAVADTSINTSGNTTDAHSELKSSTRLPDLTDEQQAELWIRSAPPAFCNTHDKKILQQVLNDYDQETTDFYRWHVRLTQEEICDLLQRKLNCNLGAITDLIPLQRGKSGRICLLKIVGTNRSIVIGKELEIRRALSKTHLYSSAFVVDKEPADDKGIPKAFVLTGAGWGHGVGLCQIGAAVMGEQGYNYKEILEHYYPGAEISIRYTETIRQTR